MVYFKVYTSYTVNTLFTRKSKMKNKFIKISEFGSISGIPRKTLIFYDKINLLSPDKIDGNNGYRYYSYHQIDTASVIKTLCEIGMPLKEVKSYLYNRSPDDLINVLENCSSQIELQIERLNKLEGLINARLDLTKKGLNVLPKQIQHEFCPEEKLFLGPSLPETETLEEAWGYLPDFYTACSNKQVEFGRPIGCIIKKEFLSIKGYHCLSNYYYKLSDNDVRANYVKPSGLYVIGYDYIGYGQTDDLYDRIIEYMHINGLTACGDIYSEYILDEIAVSNPNNYLIQVAVQVMA